MSTQPRNVRLRGTTMAIACVTVIGVTLSGMYYMGRDVKQKEGMSSPYTQGGTPGSDMKMNSADVAAAVSLPKPGKERLSQRSDPERRN